MNSVRLARSPASACWRSPAATQGASSGGKGTANIGIELPQQGSEQRPREPIINGIKLAVKEAGGERRRLQDRHPELGVLDDALNGAHDPQTGANNMTQDRRRPERRRGHRPAQLERRQGPDPDLERGRPAAVLAREHERGPDQGRARRAGHPQDQPPRQLHPRRHDRRHPGSGGGAYILRGARKKTVYIIDDTETFGKGIADDFEKYFTGDGGTVVARDGAPKTTTDYTAPLTAAKAKNPSRSTSAASPPTAAHAS